MSAAAMLACAADQIIMSGFASLSPTNPLVVVPTMGDSMMLPAQAVVDERNELLHRLQGPDGTGEDLMSLVLQRRMWRTTLEASYQRVAKPPSFEYRPCLA